jgi:hypothetical protein
MSNLNLIHMASVMLFNELLGNLWFTCANAICLVIADRRIAGMHVTLLTSITNQAQFAHKFYLFKLVDSFGLFQPMFCLTVFSLGVCLYMRKSFCALDKVPIKNWQVSSQILSASVHPEDSPIRKDKKNK